MANFCTKCGSPLVDGKCSNCGNVVGQIKENVNNSGNAYQNNSYQGNTYQNDFNAQKEQFRENTKTFWESMKNRMGIGSPELNQGDAFEENKRIVPDCINANEGEIPVKQYQVAKLRNRIIGITYSKAVGRIQVTNKRIVFRAPGRSIAGRTQLQQEFAIDEIAGIESRREYTFNVWDFIIGILALIIGQTLMTVIMKGIAGGSFYYRDSSVVGPIILALLFGVVGCVPFFMIKRKWPLKLICLGTSASAFGTASMYARFVGHSYGESNPLVVIFYILLFATAVFIIFAIIINAIKPNLVIVIKNKGAHSAIDIQRKKIGLGMKGNEDHTGYAEVLPEDDVDIAIIEINAMITDIQKLGDFGIDKWKEN